jgi:hypothetical protein
VTSRAGCRQRSCPDPPADLGKRLVGERYIAFGPYALSAWSTGRLTEVLLEAVGVTTTRFSRLIVRFWCVYKRLILFYNGFNAFIEFVENPHIGLPRNLPVAYGRI